MSFDDVHIVGKMRPGGGESGLWISGGTNVPESPLSFTNGSITNVAGNNLLGENWRGGLTISGSTFVQSGSAFAVYHHQANNPATPANEQVPGPLVFTDNDITGQLMLRQLISTIFIGHGPVTVADNRFTSTANGQTAIAVSDRQNTSVTITGNTFSADGHTDTIGAQLTHATPSGTGFISTETVDVTIEENDFGDLDRGIISAAGRTREGTVELNRFAGLSGNAIEAAADTTFDAASNWWGCNEGPTDAACAPVTGAGTVDVPNWIVASADISSSSLQT